jgi:hypothetical protein
MQHQAAVLGGHPREKPVRAAATLRVRLKSTLHRPGSGKNATRGRTINTIRAVPTLSMDAHAHQGRAMIVTRIVTCLTVCYSPAPYQHRIVLSGGFPQLWKNLWKIRLFAMHPPRPALNFRHSVQAKVHEGAILLGISRVRRVTSALHRCDSRRKCQFP